MSQKNKSPRKLQAFVQDDLLPIKDRNDDFLVVTKIETKNVIKEYINDEFKFLTQKVVNTHRESLEGDIDSRMAFVEKSVSAYIDYKFDKLAESICDLLITRKFKEEVERRVNERLSKKDKF